MAVARLLIQFCLILLTMVATAVSCGEESTKVPSQSAPNVTVTLTPEHTSMRGPAPLIPTAKPASELETPTLDTQAEMTALEYADTCGELFVLEAEGYARYQETGEGGGREGERTYIEWVDMYSALEPPLELADLHEARMAKFSSTFTVETSDGRPFVMGSSSRTQAAYVREMEIVAGMPMTLRDILLEKGCLNNVEVQLGKHYLEARERIATRGPAPNPPTVRDYAERCADVMATVPLMDSPKNLLLHIALGINKLTPPPELEQYHEYSIMALRHWTLGGRDSPLPKSVIDRGKEAMSQLDPQVFDTLSSTGCIRENRNAR